MFSNSSLLPSQNVDWHKGVNFGITSNIKLASIFYISPAFEYSTYSFDKFKSSIWLDVYDRNSVFSVNGENLKSYRMAVDFKLLQAEPHILRFFIHTGISYLIDPSVSITTVSKNYNGVCSSYIQTIEEANYFVHNFGIGFIADVIKPVGLVFEGQYYSDYNKIIRFLLNAGIVYNFAD
jgi:hypothetical protein